jgi:hypothetical protein
VTHRAILAALAILLASITVAAAEMLIGCDGRYW